MAGPVTLGRLYPKHLRSTDLCVSLPRNFSVSPERSRESLRCLGWARLNRLPRESRNCQYSSGFGMNSVTRIVRLYYAGIEPVADVESELRQDITPTPDADPLLGSVASEVVRYLASFAMTAVATAVAVGVDSKVTIPNLSLIFVVPVIIAGVSLGLGPSLCSAILGAIAFNFFLTEPRYTLVVDALAASGHAAAPPRSVMTSRRFTRSPRRPRQANLAQLRDREIWQS